MSYTNGFDQVLVLDALKKRLGWRQPTMSGSPVLSADNIASASGRFFQAFHAMVTIANLKAVVEDPDINDTNFNSLLVDLQTDAIMRCLSEVFREPELIEQKLIYTRFGTQDQSVNNSNLFVGYEINIANDFGISTQINSGTLYFDQDCSFNLYLFQDGIKLPLKTIAVDCVAYQRTVIDFNTLVLNFKTGRKYYFGYFQSELGSARAVREQVETWATTKCFEAFMFTAPVIGSTDFNHNYRQFGQLPLGLNLEMISFKDHTQKILRKANLFDEAQGLTMAAMVIEQIVNSTRANSKERITQQQAGSLYMDINQAYPTKDAPITAGLKSRLNGEYQKLKNTFYPKQEAVSLSMESCGSDNYEASWLRQNLRILSNPPVEVQ